MAYINSLTQENDTQREEYCFEEKPVEGIRHSIRASEKIEELTGRHRAVDASLSVEVTDRCQ